MLNVKLAFRYTKKGGTKTAIAFIGVFFAAFLFSFISFVSSSSITSLRRYVFQRYGGYHVLFAGESERTIKEFVSDKNISEYAFIHLRSSASENGGDWDLFEVSANWTEFIPACISEGFFPENENQIIVPDYLTEALPDYKIGGYIKDEHGDLVEIVGTYALNDLISIMISFGIDYSAHPVFFTVQNNPDITSGFLILANLSPLRAVQSIGDKYGWDSVIINRNYLDVCPDNIFTESTYKTIQNVKKIVYCLTAITSLLFIGSAFSVLFSENTKEYALLSSMGATVGELASIMFYQTLFIATGALIPGIILGAGSVWTFLGTIEKKLKALIGINLKLVLSADFNVIVSITILTYITAILSASVSIIGFKKKMPLALLRKEKTENIFSRNGERRKSNIIATLRKRYSRLHLGKRVVIIVSLSMIIVLYLGFITIVKATLSEFLQEYDSRWCDIAVSNREAFNEDNKTSFFKWYNDKIVNDSRIDEAYWILDSINVDFQRSDIGLSDSFAGDTYKIFRLVFIDDALFEEYCRLFETDTEKIGGILTANDAEVVFDKGEYVINFYDLYSKPEIHTLFLDDLNDSFVFLCVNKGAINKKSTFFGQELNDFIILPYSSYKPMSGNDSLRTIVFSDDYLELESEFVSQGFNVNNLRKSYNDDLKIAQTWNYLANSFLIILSVILISYVLFSSYTYAMMRKKDYVVLKSLGMNTKQQSRMFLSEAIGNMIGVFGLGGIGSTAAILLVSNLMRTSVAVFPILESGLCFLFICIIYLAAGLIAYSVMNHVNIVDEIR